MRSISQHVTEIKTVFNRYGTKMCRNSKNAIKPCPFPKSMQNTLINYTRKILKQIASEMEICRISENWETIADFRFEMNPNDFNYTHKSIQITRTRPEQRQCKATPVAVKSCIATVAGAVGSGANKRTLGWPKVNSLINQLINSLVH